MLDLLVYARFALLLITLVVPPAFCYRFQPASLASFLFFNLVVESLLSSLDLCNTPSSSKDVGSQRHCAFMVCHARVWIGTPTTQLVSCGNAAVQFLD